MTIGKKLFASFGATLALTLAIGGVAISAVGSIDGRMENIVQKTARKLFIAGDINAATSDIVAGERGTLLRAYMNDYAGVSQYETKQQQLFTQLKKDIDVFTPLVESEEGRQMIAQVRDEEDSMIQNHRDLMALIGKRQLAAAGKFTDQKVMPLADKVSAEGADLATLQNRLMDESAKEAAATTARGRSSIMLMIVVSLAIGVVIAWIVRATSGDLRRAARELSKGADQVASAAGQVSAVTQSLAQGSSEQAASLEETSASSEQINAMALRNAESSQAAAGLVFRSQEKYDKAHQSLDQMVDAMNGIRSSSDNISKIIRVIDEIAFQTNILALNAAVEAARAGEAGMGFAVVADEVRNLAQRCAQAAKDTTALIEESIAKSAGGKQKVDQVTGAIRSMTADSGKVKDLMDEMNMGSQEQTRGIAEVTKAITQMQQVTQQTAACAEEGAAAAEELSAQSQALKDIVDTLTDMVGRDSGVAESSYVRNRAGSFTAA